MDKNYWQSTVRNPNEHPYNLSSSSQNSSRNYIPPPQNTSSSSSSRFISPANSNPNVTFNKSSTSTSTDVKIDYETDVEEEDFSIKSENYSTSGSDSESDDFYSLKNNNNAQHSPMKRKKMENPADVKKSQSTISFIKYNKIKCQDRAEKGNVPSQHQNQYQIKNCNIRKSHTLNSNSNNNNNKNNNNESGDVSAPLPSSLIHLSNYKDYIHCYKCFSTFYKLVDLIIHFDKCSITRDGNFKDFKQSLKEQETGKQNSSSYSSTTFKINNTNTSNQSTITNEETENESFNNNNNNNFEPSSSSPLMPFLEQEEQEEINNNHTSHLENSYGSSQSDEYFQFNSNSSYPSPPDENAVSSELQSQSSIEPLVKENKNKEKQGIKKRPRKKPQQHSEVPYKCPVEACSATSFENHSSLQYHKETEHDVFKIKTPVACPTCGKTVPGQSELLVHLNSHTGYRPYKCKIEGCDKSFIARASCISHLQSIHRKTLEEKVFQCPADGCIISLPVMKELKEHVNSAHPGLVRYKCKHCDEGFVFYSDKLDHHRKFHADWKYVCDVEDCRKLFRSSSDLKSHKTAHRTDRPFECEVEGCGMKFKQKYALLKHTRVIHEKSEQCLCTECGKTFSHIEGYKRHLLTHAKQKPHICHYCGWAFKLRHTLKNHMLTHTGQKDKKCRFCEKRFASGNTLLRHQQTHTKINPYKCAFCDACFPDNRPLKKHIEFDHKDEEFDLNVPSTYQREKPTRTLKP